MAEQNPTVIIAHLNDENLRKSIDDLVGYVDKQFQSMVSTTSTRVGEMQAELSKLSQIKIYSKGSGNGGSSKRVETFEKLQKAVNDASEAVSRETQKLQGLQQSLSGVSDREQVFISQKERATGTIAKENELLQRQQQELANLKNQQQQLANEKTGFEKQRQDAIALRKAVSDLSFTRAEFSLFSAINQYGEMYGRKNPFSKNGLFETGDAAFLDIFASKLKTATEEAEKWLLTL